MIRKLIYLAALVIVGYGGEYIGRRIGMMSGMQIANEAVLSRLGAASSQAYWRKKDEVAAYALRQYADTLQFVGWWRLGKEGETEDDIAVTDVRLAKVFAELGQTERVQPLLDSALEHAKRGTRAKSASQRYLQELVANLDSKQVQ